MKLEKSPPALSPRSRVQVTHREIDSPEGVVFVTKADTQGELDRSIEQFKV